MATQLLELRDVQVHYGAFHALKGVSLDIARGERMAIFGHNGSGKSTLLKACVGVHKTMSGRISFEATQIVAGAVPRNVQLGIGYVPQSGNVFAELSVD